MSFGSEPLESIIAGAVTAGQLLESTVSSRLPGPGPGREKFGR